MSILPVTTPRIYSPLSEYEVRTLVACEYDFIGIDAEIGALIGRLHNLGILEQSAGVIEQVQKARDILRAALVRLDGPLSDAIVKMESYGEPPF